MKYLFLTIAVMTMVGCGKDAVVPVTAPAPAPIKPLVFTCPVDSVKECQFINCRCWNQAQGKYVPGAWVPGE